MKMEFPLSIVDAFIVNEKSFTGNAAAVCFLEFDDDISDEIKQKIASEMNLSETSFVAKAWNKNSNRGNNTLTLRWFTPTTEIELCGHATLASARVIFDNYSQYSNNNCIKFETKFKGILEAYHNLSEQTITLDFPLNDCKPIDIKSNLLIEDIVRNILGKELTLNHIKDIELSFETNFLLISLKDSEDFILKVSPDFNQLLEIETNNLVKAVIVTQKPSNDKNVDFYSRFFAPWLGNNEDPVTGAAHTVLTPYWIRQYHKIGIQTNKLIGKQCSKRQGIVFCKMMRDRVQITGKTKTSVSGKITI